MGRQCVILDDLLWGLWPEDSKTPIILNGTNSLIAKYGLHFDIVYDDAKYNVTGRYSQVYYWNSTLT